MTLFLVLISLWGLPNRLFIDSAHYRFNLAPPQGCVDIADAHHGLWQVASEVTRRGGKTQSEQRKNRKLRATVSVLMVRNSPQAGPTTPNKRSLAGAGLGLKFYTGAWSLDTFVAWRTDGGRSTSDGTDRNRRLWVSVGYQF